jgi:glycosyltransferase involved in cell wall biosynthesis
MMMGPNAFWITWESQPRNRSMARELGIPLHELSFSGPRLARHFKSVVSTLRLLLRERPSVVFSSNPSLVLTYLLLLSRRLFGFKHTIDAHYGGVVSVSGSRLLQLLLDFANRHADTVIVTNEVHAEHVRQVGGTPFVCPDPLPTIRRTSAKPAALRDATKSVLFVCSYDWDEPYQAVFDAAAALGEHGFRVFASGAHARVGLSPRDVPHVTLLGYVARAEYEAYIQHVDVVLDLTIWQDCLVCGAYEAMAVRKPAVLSRTRSLTELFTHGTVFTSHEPRGIVAAVCDAYDRRQALSAQIDEWVDRHEADLRKRATALRATVGLPLTDICVSPSLATSL